MDFEPSDKVLELRARVDAFMDEHIFPRELEHGDWVENPDNAWSYPPWFEGLKDKARAAGIWNWFLPKDYEDWSPGLTNLEFAPLMERICRVPWAQEVFNCSAPDRGNMEVLARFGNEQQQEQCRLLVLAAADKMDKYGPKGARDFISMVKIAAPQMCQQVADRALQAHGGMGVTQDTPIARIYLTSRYCRIADGPDEVHMSQLGRRTIRDMTA